MGKFNGELHVVMAGSSTGLTWLTCRLGSNAERMTVQRNWPIVFTDDGCWPITELFDRLAWIRSQVKQGAAIVGGVPGSVVVPFMVKKPRLHPDDVGKVQSYESLAGEENRLYKQSRDRRGVTPLEYHQRTGGIADEFWQPPTHMEGYLERWPNVLRDAKAWATLADLFSYALIGEPRWCGLWGHDLNQAKIQGLLTQSMRELLRPWGGHLPSTMVPWGFYDDREVVQCRDGIFVVPTMHDTYGASLVAMDESGRGRVVIAGSWDIVTKLCHREDLPELSAATVSKVVIEGAPKCPTVNAYVCKGGPPYKWLVQEGLKCSFADMTERMRDYRRELPTFSAADLPKDTDSAINFLRGVYGGLGMSEREFFLRAAKGLTISIAVDCLDQIPERPCSVFLGGGGGENACFRELLTKGGLTLEELPFPADQATPAGLIAEAARRLLDVPIHEALKMIPR